MLKYLVFDTWYFGFRGLEFVFDFVSGWKYNFIEMGGMDFLERGSF